MTTQKATPKIEIIKTVLLACILILLVVGFILSLQTVAEKLQSAVNAISSIKNIFGG